MGSAESMGICGMPYTGSPIQSALSTASLGSVLHRGSSTTLSAGTPLPHCGYSASYLIAIFCASGVTDSPHTDCYPTALHFLCCWSHGLEWSPRCNASDTNLGHSALFLSGLKTTLFDQGRARSAPE